MEFSFERRADSQSYCFFAKAPETRRAFREGCCGPRQVTGGISSLLSLFLTVRLRADTTIDEKFRRVPQTGAECVRFCTRLPQPGGDFGYLRLVRLFGKRQNQLLLDSFHGTY